MIPQKFSYASKVVQLIAVSAITMGCVQMPTEKQSVSDLRPQISFKANLSDQRMTSARVLIDNVDVGAVQEYLEGINTLKLQSGTHQLRIVQGNQILHDERFYAGDGVNKSFVVK